MTVHDALALGFTRYELRSKALAAPAWGTRILSAPAQPGHDLLAAIDAVRRPDQFLSHATAARIHGLPLPSRIQPIPIHLASPSYTSRMRRPDVLGHRIKARVVLVRGVPVESLEDCFVHVASLLEHDELVAVGDAIVSPARRDRLEIADLVRNAEHFRGARGMSRVARALGAVRVGSESPQETRTRLPIVRAGIREPELQIEVVDDDGSLVGRLDMGWRDLRLGVEYDGQHHRTDARQYAWDIERHRRLQEAGWEVIRVTAPDLGDGARRMLAIIRAAIARRAR